MALTNAERQAAFKARRAETMDALAQQNAALLAEVAELRAELDAEGEGAQAGGGSAQGAAEGGAAGKVEAVKRPAVKKAAKRG